MHRTDKKTNNLVIVSDLHCGCRLGLCPPDGVSLDDGGTYMPSAFQNSMWRYWREFWTDWVPVVTKREPYYVVFNGDTIDGVHHNSTTQISHNIADQLNIAEFVVNQVKNKTACRGIYLIRGTGAHDGESGVHAEELAARVGAIPNADGQRARYELWKRVGDALCHILHTIGTTSSAAHEASAVNAELSAEYVEAARWAEEAPDYVIRSHRHRHIVVDIASAKGTASAVVTPGWQAKTPYSFKLPGARLAQPQFGGIVIRQGDEEHFMRAKIWRLDRPKEE